MIRKLFQSLYTCTKYQIPVQSFLLFLITFLNLIIRLLFTHRLNKTIIPVFTHLPVFSFCPVMFQHLL